jgi:hypothetical protein
MVLFNSPVDRHQISLLARRIYPKTPDKMMNKYEEAMSRPYGYLLIDFKPGTAESQRLQTDILSPQIGLNENVIRGKAEPRPFDLREPEVEPIPQIPERKDIAIQTVKLTETEKLTTKRKRIMSDSEEDMPLNCYDCGQVFATLHDLQRHVIKLRCPELTIDEPPTKKVKTDVGMSDLTDIVKNDTFQYLKYVAEKHNSPLWSKKFGKYVDKDQMDKAQATLKADEKIRIEDKREFFRRYTHLLKLMKHVHTVLQTFKCSIFAFCLHFVCVSFAFRLHFVCLSFAFHLRFICVSFAFRLRFICVSFCQF